MGGSGLAYTCTELGAGSHLLDGALSLEEDSPSQQLCKDAAHRPDVDGRAVVPAAHQHLRRPVVLGHHLLGHVPRLIGLLHARQPEIADLSGDRRRWSKVFLPGKQGQRGASPSAGSCC